MSSAINTLNLVISNKPRKLNNSIFQDLNNYYFYYYKDLSRYIEPAIKTQLLNIPENVFKQFKSFEDFMNKAIERERLVYITTNLTLNQIPSDYVKAVESDFSNETLETQLAYIIHESKDETNPNIFHSLLQLLIQQHNINSLLAIRCCYDCVIEHIHNIYNKYVSN